MIIIVKALEGYSENLKNLSLDSENEEKERDIIYRYFRRNYLSKLPSEKEIRIIDVGCGRGKYINACLKEGYKNVCGIDMAPSNVAYCKKRGYEEYIFTRS